MNENELLSKKEYEILQTIDKQNLLIEKLKSAFEKEKSTVNTISNELDGIKKELAQTVYEAQTYINALDDEHENNLSLIDQLNKKHEAISSDFNKVNEKVLPENEYLFYLACKADSFLHDLFQKKIKVLSLEDLKNIKFPLELLEKFPSGIRTSNYVIQKIGEQEYQLSKTK